MENIGKIMQQALAQNEAAAQHLVAGARAEREAAAAERAAAQEILLQTERNETALYAGFVEKHRSRIRQDLNDAAVRMFAERLILAGEPVSEVAALLDLPDGLVQEMARKHGL